MVHGIPSTRNGSKKKRKAGRDAAGGGTAFPYVGTATTDSKRFIDNALVALTLLIAESKLEEKDTIVKVVVNLINRCN
ncbi:hypothetical protein [Geothermobacter hydrogeniphilus]|uniref:hypothetical protein n=1 Tax=Geothermobacter hydrogeniphilus TaxID=1969733 RepID=UPI001FE64180|nr:hypothetical protein [Geothermobacter hydrogeniphilus]